MVVVGWTCHARVVLVFPTELLRMSEWSWLVIRQLWGSVSPITERRTMNSKRYTSRAGGPSYLGEAISHLHSVATIGCLELSAVLVGQVVVLNH